MVQDVEWPDLSARAALNHWAYHALQELFWAHHPSASTATEITQINSIDIFL